jgi:Double zinc ribbon
MVVLVCVLLAGAAIGFTLVVREQDIPPAPVEDPELKHLEIRRQTLYDNLKDLQFEYHQGKLSEEDYQSLKHGFLYDLAGVMDSIERRTLRKPKPAKGSVSTAPTVKAAAAGEQRPAAVAVATPEMIACPSCGAANPAVNRFCGQCAQPLSAACPACKAVNPLATRFCGRCGQPLPH